jgi:hypothetical protein
MYELKGFTKVTQFQMYNIKHLIIRYLKFYRVYINFYVLLLLINTPKNSPPGQVSTPDCSRL